MRQSYLSISVLLRLMIAALVLNLTNAVAAPSPSMPATVAPAGSIGPDPGPGFVRLPGHVLDSLDRAEVLQSDKNTAGKAKLTLTLVLRRENQAAFDRYLADVYDPHSKHYRQFLSQAQIAERFGPSRRTYAAVRRYLTQSGFELLSGSKNRLTLTVRGTRRAAQQAFQVNIRDVQWGAQRRYANDADPAVPIELAPHIQAIVGLLTPPQPMPAAEGTPPLPEDPGWDAMLKGFEIVDEELEELAGNSLKMTPIVQATTGNGGAQAGAIAAETEALEDLEITDIFLAEGLEGAESKQVASRKSLFRQNSATVGTGQKIGITSTSAFLNSDVADWLALAGLPASLGNQVSQVPVAGGAPIGPGETDVLLGIDTILSLTPGAQIVVYEAPFASNAASFQAVLNAMIDDGVTVISNTNIYCEDQTTLADVQSLDATLATAAASGISVFSATGDSGSTCSDGTASTIAVPTDSPHVTAVGGSTGTVGAGNVYGSESWFDGSNDVPPLGPAGFGVSRYFQAPAYQSSLAVSTMRSVPDVVTLADPKFAPYLCEADAGGCPASKFFGGTSLATPLWAAYTAALNQLLQKPLGLLNPSLYATAAASTFHSAGLLNTDAAHVGLGSPDVTKLYLALSGKTVGPVSATTSTVTASTSPGLVLSTSVPADGTTAVAIAVLLTDANGFPISGKSVTLAANGSAVNVTPSTSVTNSENGAAVFEVTAMTPGSVTFTATDATDGVVLTATATVTFAGPAAASGGINVAPAMVAADGVTPATITVTLKDANNQPAIGKTVTVMDGGAHAVITGPTPPVTDANGQIQFSATDQVNETVTFTAVDESDNNLTIPGSGTVTYSGSTNTACGVGLIPAAGAGYAISPFITGLPAAATLFYQGVNLGCPGGNTPTFTSNGTVLVTDGLTGALYQFGLSGGVATPATLLNTIAPAVRTPVYGKDGSVYATVGGEGGEIVQIDPATGNVLRLVASGLTCPGGLSVDPLSGDLFFDDGCTGGGTDNASVYRILDPANTNPSVPTSVVVYATLPQTPNGGMAFAPNGTLYAVSGYYVSGYSSSQTAEVVQVSATNAASVSMTPLTGLTSDYSVAVGVANPDGSAQSLIVEPSGTLTEIPIAAPNSATVLATVPNGAEVTGPSGVGAVGPDGCLYLTHYDTVYRLTNADGSCTYSPTSPAPSINLTPASVSPNPAQGATQSFTATVHNVSPLAGVAVNFLISGANAGLKLVRTDTNGNATLTYPGIFKGTDKVIATAAANASTNFASNIATVTWAAGSDTSFLTLNSSPTVGTIKQQTTVVGSLADVSVSPPTAVAGQTVTFGLGTSSCTGTTNAAGNASCALTPSQAGAGTLTANFAGNAQLIASSASTGFNVSAPPAPPPTVTITANPATIAAGGSSTLTWSSTNATSCSASGSWSGTQAVSGTQTVTPAATGTYTYSLTCTGSDGSAQASVTLSATLVTVTVNAKAGGGAMTWPLLAFLAMLAMLRMKTLFTVGRGDSGSAGGRDGGSAGVILRSALFASILIAAADPCARASESTNTNPGVLDEIYVGIRVGGMPLRLNAGDIDARLATEGFGGVAASTDTSALAGTVYAGFDVAKYADIEADIEVGFTHRNAYVATLTGTVATTASIPQLLQDTAGAIRGYGNIFSLTFRPRVEAAPNFMIDPRIGGFFWDTKLTAEAAGARIADTHEGGGVTAGIGAAYRVWRGLEIGLGADYFRGSPSNHATLYSGSLEWRFGR